MTANADKLHIDTHHDAIWYSGCLDQERAIVQRLSKLAPTALVKPVDAVSIHPQDLVAYKLVITDNVFIREPAFAVINLSPYFWGIYACDPITNTITLPSKKFNCMINRISGERQRMLYCLYDQGLLSQGHVSYNCLYHAPDPGWQQRRKNFEQVRIDCDLIEYADAHAELAHKVPLLLNMTPDQAAMDSVLTVVMETYASDWLIAVSEKIFRALQTPRPWIVYCSPGTVALLRDTGFDVLDDIIDHNSYDMITNSWQRMDQIVRLIKYHDTPLNTDRLTQAAAHNRNRLLELKKQLPDHLDQCVQSIGVKYQSDVNTKSVG